MSTVTTTSLPATSPPLKRLIVSHPLVAFFVIAFAGSWIVWLPLVLAQDGLGVLSYTVPGGVSNLLFTLGIIAGPTLAALITTAITGGRASVWQFLRRYIQWRVGIQWYLLCLFGFISVYLLMTSIFLGATLLHALLQKWSLIFSVFLPAILIVLLRGQLWEEPGWRGFALPRLQPKVGAVGASLIIGILQGLWHVPLLFIPGMIFQGKFMFTIPSFLGGVFSLVGLGMTIGVIMTWLYNNTQGSLLIVILFHTVWDATNSLVQHLIPTFVPQASVLVDIGYVACAVFLIIVTKGRLSYKPEQNAQLVVAPGPVGGEQEGS
jgi:membrane protease YdiL (CAAX protease family)